MNINDMTEEELYREIKSGAFSMQVADCERNIRIQFEKLQQEKKQLKYNWNKLRETLKNQQFGRILYSDRKRFANIDEILDKMQELEKSEINE